MEQLDLEQPGGGAKKFRNVFNANGPTGGACGRPLIALRKYSPIICLVELATIVIFVYLLLFHSPSSKYTQNFDCATTSKTGQRSARVFTWHNGSEVSGPAGKQLLLDPIGHCDQRKHDFQMSVQCRSERIDLCGPVERQAAYEGSSKALKKRVTVIISSKRGERLTRRDKELEMVQCGSECKFKTRVQVDASEQGRHQKIIGWGGALTDSTLNNILGLTANGTGQLLRDYYGPDGLMYNIIRVTIGGSDFSARFYTNDDSPSDDLKLKNFKLREEDILYKIPTLKLIQERFSSDERLVKRNGGAKLKLFASMWSPPVWMKTNGHFNKGQLRGAIDDEPLFDRYEPPASELFYEALAELKIRFLKAYHREGIHFWGLTVMNEPVFSVQPFLDFNTMIFPREDYANYVAKYLGPKLKNEHNLAHIKLMSHDDNRRFLANFTWPIMDQRRVRQFLDGVSVHGYADEAYHLMNATWERYRDDIDWQDGNGADRDKPADENFFVLPTELCSGHLPFMAKALIGNWHRGVHYALDVIRSLQNAAAGWVDWNMALDLEGGPGWLGGRLDAPVIVDKARDLYHKSPMFYVLGQFSRYIPPGSVRLETQVDNIQFDHEFEVVAFLLPAQRKQQTEEEEGREQEIKVENVREMALVVVNNNPYAVDVYLRVRDGRRPASSSAHHVILPCPADSVQTLIYALEVGPEENRQESAQTDD